MLSHPSPNVKIHAVVSAVSPMKQSKNCSFFDGEISDGKATMRVFGFDSGVRRKLVEFEESKDAVALSKCEVKHARKGDQLEVLVTKYTELEKSEKVFDVVTTDSKRPTIMEELQDLVPFQRVTAEVKVVRVDEAAEVSGGKRKQDILVRDRSGSGRLTVWEGEIGKVEGKSYRLSGMMVREFRGKKFLSTSKENSLIEVISDIGDVDEEESEEESNSADQVLAARLNNVRVVGVMQLDRYNGCLKCAAKVVPDDDDADLGHCVKCGMMQCLEASRQELSAKLMIKGVGGLITLRAFGKIVQEIAHKDADKVTMGVLLKAKAFNLVHRDRIIQSISRKA